MINIFLSDISDWHQGSSGLISGVISLEIDNSYFPEKEWNDFPIIILGWWINSYLKFIKQNLDVLEFCFMDGPFKLIGLKTENEMIGIYTWNQYDANEKKYVGSVDKKEIQNILLKACRKVFRKVELSNISNDKIEGLKKLFCELKKM